MYCSFNDRLRSWIILDASVLFIVLKSAPNCRKHLLFKCSMLILFCWARSRIYQNCLGVIRRSFQSGCSLRINLMVPERGKSSGGCVKRCKVLVFEMCSSIQISFAVGKNRKGPALNGLVLDVCSCVGAFFRSITGTGGWVWCAVYFGV